MAKRLSDDLPWFKQFRSTDGIAFVERAVNNVKVEPDGIIVRKGIVIVGTYRYFYFTLCWSCSSFVDIGNSVIERNGGNDFLENTIRFFIVPDEAIVIKWFGCISII